MNTLSWILLLVLLVAVITYFAGPKVPEPVYTTDLPAVPTAPADAQQFVELREASAPTRPDNEARIVWHNDEVAQTEYSIVYLHGFGGSYYDGYPVNQQVADSLGANVYMARWGDHGLQPEHALARMTPESCWEDAKTALLIGQAIGRKVIVMSTSTGGTLALKLAAEFPDRVHALVNISPNVEDDMPGAWVLNSNWGYELASLVSFGKHREVSHEEPGAAQYFDTLFPSEALVELQVLVSTTMLEETYNRITSPVQTLYYYKNWLEEDERVEVDVYPEVHEALATPADRRELKNLPTPETHWMGCEMKSKDVDATRMAILDWLGRMGIQRPAPPAADL